MQSEIIRYWTNRGARVSTVHPEYGELDRGNICPVPAKSGTACMAWQVSDQDWVRLGTVDGDYVTAEQRLLKATSWADDTPDRADQEPEK